MMMNSSDQSETTSLTQSWPTTPKRSPAATPLYYVQSPSSHEEEDKGSWIQGMNTPRTSMDSPLGSTSAASRVSGSSMRGKTPWRREWRVILEEEEEERRDEPMRRRHVCGLGLIAIVGVFSVFCFVMWIVSSARPFVPRVSVEKLTVNDFYTGQGLDIRGVPTKLLTVNCLVQLRFHNPASFFGIHISSTSFNILYYDLILASSQIKYYQERKSWRDLSVEIQAKKFPLYGAGLGFAASREVPLKLEFEFKTRGDVVGKLVRSKNVLRGSCPFTIDPNNPKSVKFLEDSCTYH